MNKNNLEHELFWLYQTVKGVRIKVFDIFICEQSDNIEINWFYRHDKII